VNPTKPDSHASGLKTTNRETALAAALEETNSLLVAMLHENRSLAEIEERIHDNRTVLNAEATTTRSAEPVCAHRDEPKACYRVRCQLGNKCADDDMSPRVWLCTCGTPSLPGVLHRADRPCYRVEENQSCD
jgi:hypothetical protein